MTTSFTIQEYSIPASILQQILAKMELKSLVRLCQTSTYGQDTVDELQSARLERYLAAKRDEHELSKVSPCFDERFDPFQFFPRDEIPSKRTLETIIRMERFRISIDGHNLDKGPFANWLAKRVELAQKTLENWEILH